MMRALIAVVMALAGASALAGPGQDCQFVMSGDMLVPLCKAAEPKYNDNYQVPKFSLRMSYNDYAWWKVQMVTAVDVASPSRRMQLIQEFDRNVRAWDTQMNRELQAINDKIESKPAMQECRKAVQDMARIVDMRDSLKAPGDVVEVLGAGKNDAQRVVLARQTTLAFNEHYANKYSLVNAMNTSCDMHGNARVAVDYLIQGVQNYIPTKVIK
ncbi:hypothetical protein [Achromobacter phage Motura]|uniref:Uncharacterized protein n=1 Tax=Achromobacter phage Motura TaxID=2591403 RepID=A0A514CSN6_9CAUD|nr:hypothetical protein H1O15_gp314 [Achromobacter phage Motura]QDH83492.1 hypothetical protein [Achromobacter phage Motura]